MITTRNSEWYFEKFVDFCSKVNAISGATPHLKLIGESSRGLGVEEVIWRGGCYAATYNYPAAEAIWLRWTPESVLSHSEEFFYWIKDNWPGLPLRKERKAVNSPQRLAGCFASFALWHKEKSSSLYQEVNRAREPYRVAWESFTSVRYMGRYIAIRFLEYLRRYAGLQARMPDSRPEGGEHPRQGLALLYPEYEEVLRHGKSKQDLATCNAVAEKCLSRMHESGVKLTHYELQSLICEYKQAAIGKHQYPVQAIDSELGYYDKVSRYFGNSYKERSQFFDLRKALFPNETLGEMQGWNGKRKILGTVLHDYGYNWSDLQFDFLKTADFSKPVERGSEAILHKERPALSTGNLFGFSD